MCYNGFVKSARFLPGRRNLSEVGRLPAAALATADSDLVGEEGALRTMPARHAVLPTLSVPVRSPEVPSYRQIVRQSAQFPLFVFKRLRTLSFSVSRKSFACHFENCRGVYQQFRFWNSPSPVITALLALSFQSLTTIKSHNSFVLIFMHVMGGVCTPPGFFSIKIRRAGVASPAPTRRNRTTGYFRGVCNLRGRILA